MELEPQDSGGLLVRGTLGDLGEELIGLLLLLERLVEELRSVIHAELHRPALQRTVAGNLIMLDRLRAGKETGIERV